MSLVEKSSDSEQAQVAQLKGHQPEPQRRNRTLLTILAILVAILIFLLLEISGAFGYRIVRAMAEATGLTFLTTVEGPRGDSGPAGTDGTQGPAGISGSPGEDGRNGVNGLDGSIGLTGPAGETGESGAAGPQGPQGEPGTVLALEQGLIGIGTCDTGVAVSLSSRFDMTHMDFVLDTVTFGDVSSDCWGRNLDIYLFSGEPGSYVLAALASDVTIPSQTNFTVSSTQFEPQTIESSLLSKLAIELGGNE